MADCVEFKEALVKKLVNALVKTPGFGLLPEAVQKIVKDELEKAFKDVQGKVCLEGAGDKEGCNKGTRDKPDLSKRCCKFSARPELKVRDFPSGKFPIPPLQVEVKFTGAGAVAWDHKCAPVADGGLCDDDEASCARPVLRVELTVTETATSKVVASLMVEEDLGQKLALVCKV